MIANLETCNDKGRDYDSGLHHIEAANEEIIKRL